MQAAHTATVPRVAAAARAGTARRPLYALPAPHRRRVLHCPASHAKYKELLSTLQSLSDEQLAAWAAEEAHRERLSLPFLGWLSDEELTASSSRPEQQQQLWELGSKLMALREGLSPVGNQVLQEELRAAALRCSSGGSSASEWEDGASAAAAEGGAPRQQQGGAQQAAVPLAVPAFSSVVQQTAALGLSPEGLVLFQQQAAALEAVVGVSKARSLTEVIGRARVQDSQQMHHLAEADAAMRILDVLLSVHDRWERASMLPDAFSPPTSTAAVDDDADYFSPDEDQVSTTPLRLLQAVDLYQKRLSGGSSGGQDRGRPIAELAGGTLGLTLPQLQAALRELREDVEAYWQASDGEDAC